MTDHQVPPRLDPAAADAETMAALGGDPPGRGRPDPPERPGLRAAPVAAGRRGVLTDALGGRETTPQEAAALDAVAGLDDRTVAALARLLRQTP